jgi:hypothetical protein
METLGLRSLETGVRGIMLRFKGVNDTLLDEILVDGVADSVKEIRELFYRDMGIKSGERMALVNGRVCDLF